MGFSKNAMLMIAQCRMTRKIMFGRFEPAGMFAGGTQVHKVRFVWFRQ